MEFIIDDNLIGLRFYSLIKEAIMNENLNLEHTRSILIEHRDTQQITLGILGSLMDLAIWQGRYALYHLIYNYFQELLQSHTSTVVNTSIISSNNGVSPLRDIQTHESVIVYIQNIQFSSLDDAMLKVSCESSAISFDIKLHASHGQIIDYSRFFVCKNVGCLQFETQAGDKGRLYLEEAFSEQFYDSQSRPKDYEFHLGGAMIRVQTIAYWPFHCPSSDEQLRNGSSSLDEDESPLLIGHRGSGQHGGPHGICENTLESFARAGIDGADYIEMDIQLSQDLIPIVYHDFVVATTASSGTSESIQRSIGDLTVAELRFLLSSDISGTFCTLEEALKTVDCRIGFNIELKYPTFKSSCEESLSIPGINRYCDHVLEVVLSSLATHGRRGIYFSSFNPFVCHVMRLKQKWFRVLLLTSAGISQYRKGFQQQASSAAQVSVPGCLGKAVRTAVSCGLDGIVCEAEVFVKAARLIAKIKAETGMIVMTYGDSNNDTTLAQLQLSHGLDAIIADDVAAIRDVVHSFRSRT